MSLPDAPVRLTIDRIGARGDGIADWAGERVYLPFTAPGDVVEARLGPVRGDGRTAVLETVLSPGVRMTPACPHFGRCGGCALQHVTTEAYDAAKLAWLDTALAQQGVAPALRGALSRIPAGTRRRARLAIERPRDSRAAPRIGFHRRLSHDIVDMRACPVLHPALFALVAPLRDLARSLWAPGAKGAASLTLTDNGPDVLLDLAGPPALAGFEALAAFAEAQDVARLVWRSPGAEPVPAALRRPAQIRFGGVTVDLPEGAFLQASAEADGALTSAVRSLIGAPRRIADLFSGIGTFTFPLSDHATVHAVEGSAPAVAALVKAAARAGLAGKVTAERRDLEAAPLTPEELKGFDAVLFDPPYAGAKAQSRALAASAVPCVIAVSCNPASFARDAAILVAGGYRLIEVRPFDSFVWSPHLELVARFERAAI